MRLDLWLWAVRVFKTRSLSADSIKGGHVKINGKATKPAHEVKPEEIVTIRIGIMTRTLRVLSAPPSRVGAKLVSQFAEDLTPAEEFEKQETTGSLLVAPRPRGAGRPTKRDRRLLNQVSELFEP